MSVGCFGYSAIDRWMASNLDRYLDSQEPGSRTIAFKLFKGKKLIKKWSSEISDEDSCYYEMHEVLVEIHTRTMRKYLASLTEGPTLFSRPFKGPHTFFNPETNCSYYGSVDKDAQKRIVEKWSMLPKVFHIVNKEFNLMRIGKYSIVCNDPLTEND